MRSKPLSDLIFGADEVGAGAFAGPLIACVAAFRPGCEPPEGLKDSKAMTKRSRERLIETVKASTIHALGAASVAEVCAIGPTRASMRAMQRAILRLNVVPSLLRVDGNNIPDVPCEAEAEPKADAKYPEVMAAALIAKITRDKLMERLSSRYPHYSWEKNAGYGTTQHRTSLILWGPCLHHRHTYISAWI